MRKVITKHLLTIVLVSVLVWYTIAHPQYDLTVNADLNSNPSDAEKRSLDLDQEIAVTQLNGGLEIGSLTHPSTTTRSIDDLDWPEIIDP